MSGLKATSPYFLSQRIGRWRWPWLLASVPVAIIVTVVGLAGVYLAVEVVAATGSQWAADASVHLDSDRIATTPSLLSLELLFIGVPLWLAAAAGSIVHGRSIRSLVAPLHDFRWSIVGKILTFEVSMLALLVVVPTALGIVDGAEFTGFEAAHLVWAVPLMLFILIQTSGEDVFVKGYLLRQLGAATAVFWLAPVVVVAAFVALHLGNPDFSETLWLLLPLFVASELVIVYLMLRTGGMEAPLTLHWTNNTLIFLLFAERASQANDLTLFVWDNDPATITDDVIRVGVLGVLYLGAQLAAFTWPRSPLFLEPSDWSPLDGELPHGPTSELASNDAV